MKRKKPQEKIIKALLAKSGNLCAFPGCNHILINENNDLVAQLCHIEGVSEKGPRFNPNIRDDEINSYSNLIFLCYRHHKEIDINTDYYSVDKLKNLKEEHEKNYIENPFRFNLSVIYKIIDEYSSYWADVEFQHKNNHNVWDSDMKMEINFNADIFEIFDELYEIIKNNRNMLSVLDKSFDNLNIDFLDIVKKLNYDIRKLEDLPYYNNPFINRDWEYRKIGINNITGKLSLILKQLEVKCYENYLLVNPNNLKVKRKLNKAQSEFKEMATSYGYVD